MGGKATDLQAAYIVTEPIALNTQWYYVGGNGMQYNLSCWGVRAWFSPCEGENKQNCACPRRVRLLSAHKTRRG